MLLRPPPFGSFCGAPGSYPGDGDIVAGCPMRGLKANDPYYVF
jgi:hypothetical protein